MKDEIKRALEEDLTIDIITTGAKTGLARKTEIWFQDIDGRIIICGMPSRRDWLANLKANPEFTFCLKESITTELKA